jgi:valyl-tRNA synthetase
MEGVQREREVIEKLSRLNLSKKEWNKRVKHKTNSFYNKQKKELNKEIKSLESNIENTSSVGHFFDFARYGVVSATKAIVSRTPLLCKVTHRIPNAAKTQKQKLNNLQKELKELNKAKRVRLDNPRYYDDGRTFVEE